MFITWLHSVEHYITEMHIVLYLCLCSMHSENAAGFQENTT